jgi:peptidoglycan/LPS O-acetylase OafA/YrhL
VTNNIKATALLVLALAIGAMGIYVADADDALGAAVIGLLLMIGAVVLGVNAAQNRLPAWAARTALAVGVLIAAFAVFLTHAVAVTLPLFAQPQGVPSVIASAPSPRYAAAVERGRELVRAAVLELAC